MSTLSSQREEFIGAIGDRASSAVKRIESGEVNKIEVDGVYSLKRYFNLCAGIIYRNWGKEAYFWLVDGGKE